MWVGVCAFAGLCVRTLFFHYHNTLSFQQYSFFGIEEGNTISLKLNRLELISFSTLFTIIIVMSEQNGPLVERRVCGGWCATVQRHRRARVLMLRCGKSDVDRERDKTAPDSEGDVAFSSTPRHA